MGVDEIVLLGMRLPEASGLEFAFSSSSAVKPTPVTAVSSFGISVTRAMRSSSTKMSVQLTSSTALQDYVKLGEAKMRIVPMCSGQAPSTDCWVLME